MSEKINHPPHYGGDNTYEAIKVIEAWNLGFCLGNVVKYICRAGKKDEGLIAELRDLKKAQWYLNRHIEQKEHQWVDEAPSPKISTMCGCLEKIPFPNSNPIACRICGGRIEEIQLQFCLCPIPEASSHTVMNYIICSKCQKPQRLTT